MEQVDQNKKGGRWDEQSDFNGTAYKSSGDQIFAEIYLKKGIKIVISGRIRTGSYTDSEGVKRYSSNVVVEEHFFAESKKASDTDPKDEKDGFMSVPEDAELPFE